VGILGHLGLICCSFGAGMTGYLRHPWPVVPCAPAPDHPGVEASHRHEIAALGVSPMRTARAHLRRAHHHRSRSGGRFMYAPDNAITAGEGQQLPAGAQIDAAVIALWMLDDPTRAGSRCSSSSHHADSHFPVEPQAVGQVVIPDTLGGGSSTRSLSWSESHIVLSESHGWSAVFKVCLSARRGAHGRHGSARLCRPRRSRPRAVHTGGWTARDSPLPSARRNGILHRAGGASWP
jgi:hypothetical protein